jgi:alpha-L-rhamnosidase
MVVYFTFDLLYNIETGYNNRTLLSLQPNFLKQSSMKNKCNPIGFRILFVSFLLFSTLLPSGANGIVNNLKVDYSTNPLGIDAKTPHFSWQMATTPGERNVYQAAYQVVVKDPSGREVWDTKKILSDKSLGIEYAGSALKAATRYSWTVTVWDSTGKTETSSSWFETGLMNPDPALPAWDGAQWIGGSPNDLPLYSPYLAIFNLKYKLAIGKGSSRASFIYGANDPRLEDKYKNIYQVENKKNESYIKLELDISAVDGSENGKAKLNIYRVGYKENDSPKTP